MKKLMIATAALCAAVGVNAIESANIVGYSNTDLIAGSKATGASFVDVGADGTTLTKIVPNTAAKSAGEVKIQLLDENGYMTATYKYFKGQTRGKYTTDGWYDMSSDTLITSANDVSFPAGSGLWMDGASGYSFQTSGEVLVDDLSIDLADGSQMLANPYPVAITLTSIVPGGFTKSAGEVKIQLLDENGYMTATYKYFKGQTRGKYTTDGWYDMSSDTLITSANDVSFAAGAGLWVDGKTGYTFQFTAPSYE